MSRISRKRKLAYAVLVAVGLAFFTEAVLRLVRPELVVFANAWFHLYAYDQHMDWDLNPDQRVHFVIPTGVEDQTLRFDVATDAQGLRISADSQHSQSSVRAAGDRRRIVHCIGDSYTMGWGVEWEDSYPAVLGELLGPEHQVLNVGMAGAGLWTSVERSNRIAVDSPPDDVVYLYNMTDYSDDARAAERRKSDGKSLWPAMHLACKHSYLCSTPFALMMKVNLTWVGAGLQESIPETLSPRTEAAIAELETAASFDATDLDAPLLAGLKEFHRACEKRGTRLIVLVYDMDLNLAPRVLRVARDQNIAATSFFFGREHLLPDAHFNAAGNRRLARLVHQRFFSDKPAPVEKTSSPKPAGAD
jgi:hypothetical protein